MKAILIPVEGPVEEVEHDNELASLYELLKTDMIELVGWREDAVCIIDEEGKLKGRPANHRATFLVGPVLQRGDFIVGPMLICGGYDSEGELTDVAEDVRVLADFEQNGD